MKQFKYHWTTLLVLAISLILGSCVPNLTAKETVQNLYSSEMVFEVTLPEKLDDDEIMYLEILDEVTGIALNPTRYEMQSKDDFTLFVRIPIINGSSVNYRYVKRSDVDVIERCPDGNQVHYRSYMVNRPDVTKDIVSSWTNEGTIYPTGEISGFVYDSKTNLPIPEIFILVNGIITSSSFDGYYQIRNIPIGEHNLMAFHPDGLYQPFQQGALIAENAVTPASFGMESAKMVEITFDVEVPENTVQGAPLRFIGDFHSFGNVYSEINGGTSMITSRAPLLEYLGNRKYSITLELPSGADLRYKYSLGDGFINAEYSADGNFRTRQLIIPKKDTTIINLIESWSSKDISPITFQVTSPSNTPAGDYVSIQFNPFMWMQPIQMWKTGENKWSYTLYSPFEFLDNSQFRFCRNDQCGYADDALTTGLDAKGYILDMKTADEPRNINYKIENWAGLNSVSYEITKTTKINNIKYLLKGIEFTKNYDPKWLPCLEWGFIDAAISGANAIVFSPTWVFDNNEIPKAGYKPDVNPSNQDILKIYNYTQDAGLILALYPQPTFSNLTNSEYWANVPLTYNWWLEWFSQYEQFIINYADFAQENNIEIFIFGGESILPALPNGRLSNGNPSNTPYDFPEKWNALVEKVRAKFYGHIIFSLPSYLVEDIDHEFLMQVDAIMVENSSALTSSTSPSIDDLKSRFTQILDQSIYKIHNRYQKPIIIGITYPSIDGSASDCLNYNNPCLELVESKSSDSLPIDLNEQADIYTAILDTIIDREWITGVVSQGYYPAVIVKDVSISARGKSAMDVLSYYYNEVIH
jgi:hypothetical protein